MKHVVPLEPRPVSAAEAAVLKAAFSSASLELDVARRLGGIDALVVVARCDCGCDTVDFQTSATSGAGHPVADGLGRTDDGKTVGVIVFGTDSEITSLEIYDAVGPVLGGLRLPRPETIHGWRDHRPE